MQNIVSAAFKTVGFIRKLTFSLCLFYFVASEGVRKSVKEKKAKG